MGVFEDAHKLRNFNLHPKRTGSRTSPLFTNSFALLMLIGAAEHAAPAALPPLLFVAARVA